MPGSEDGGYFLPESWSGQRVGHVPRFVLANWRDGMLKVFPGNGLAAWGEEDMTLMLAWARVFDQKVYELVPHIEKVPDAAT